MASEAWERIDDLKTVGLCMARFKADVETKGLEYHKLKIGDHLLLGSMVVEISRVGKGCHATECPIFDPQKPCIMMEAVLYGKIVQDGLASKGDKIIIKKHS